MHGQEADPPRGPAGKHQTGPVYTTRNVSSVYLMTRGCCMQFWARCGRFRRNPDPDRSPPTLTRPPPQFHHVLRKQDDGEASYGCGCGSVQELFVAFTRE